jgi:hypothetical protein
MEQLKSNRKRRVKYDGITEDAKNLAVNRTHLWLVLEGRRVSASLMKRYNKLKGRGRQVDGL